LPVNAQVVLSAVFAAFGVVATAVVAVVVADGLAREEVPWYGAVGGIVAPMVFTLLAWRLNRWGLWVGDRGFRDRSPLYTRTIPWADIVMFEIARYDRGFLGLLDIQGIWVVLKDGSTYATELTFRDRPFVGPPIRLKTNTVMVTPQQARAALLQLRETLRAHADL